MGPQRLLFEGFELRLDSGELLRTGSLVRLQPQPAKILEILASHSGEVVSREEIRRRVWGDSYVDSDASLNFCIKEIRRALGDSATSPTFIETVPRRGYRFLKPVKVAPEAREPSVAPLPLSSPIQIPAPVPPLPATRRSRLATVGAILTLLLLLTFLLGSRFGHRVSRPRLAVLPLDCRGQEAAGQACGGITDALTGELTRQLARDLDVIAPSSVLAYRKKGTAEVGPGLKADYLVSGEAVLGSQRLELTVRLSQAGGGMVLQEQRLLGPIQDAPRLYGQVAREIASQLDLSPLPPEKGRATEPKPSSPAAYEAFLRGIYLQRHEQFEQAAAAFEVTTLLDPGFAPAYAARAQARLDIMESPPDLGVTEAVARRALALDPGLAEGHIALGRMLLYSHHDWEGARRELWTALALAPGNADAHHEYSRYLAALGRQAEAVAEVRRARELDPASMVVGSDYAWYFYLDRNYEEALRQGKAIVELFPLSADIAPIKAKGGKFNCEETILNSALALGDRATALKAANEIQAYFKPLREVRDVNEFWHAREKRIDDYLQKHPVLDPYTRAKNALALGEPERALDLLTHQCTPEGMWMPFAAVEPAFDPLHSDPRWSQVLDCLKLPADAPARLAQTASLRQ